MAEPTIMVLKVDLGCDRCYKKIKKLLSKFPEIREQAFFEKEDAVMIKVVCCSPQKIRDKLICKGGKIIKSIEIKQPPKPPPEKPKEAEKPKPPPEKPKEAEKPKPLPEKPKDNDQKPKPTTEEKPPAPVLTPVTGYPPIWPIGPCCEGHCVGPCHHGCGIPRRPPSYDGYVRLVPSYDCPKGNWPSGCRCNRSYGCRCEFLTEENPTCTIM